MVQPRICVRCLQGWEGVWGVLERTVLTWAGLSTAVSEGGTLFCKRGRLQERLPGLP